MSKAFTSEESPDLSIPGRAAERAAPGELRPITPRGHAALLGELRRLTEEVRPARRRSADPDAPAQLAALEHRVSFLLTTLESVRVVEPPADDGAVRFGSAVRLCWEDGREQTLRLVGPDEADVASGALSVEAPLARALLGREVGDEVEVRRPRGVETATILAIGREDCP